MKIGDKVKLFYDGRPLTRIIHDGIGTITKITPSGYFRIVGKTGNTERNELFDPLTGLARGWNTLWFEAISGGKP